MNVFGAIKNRRERAYQHKLALQEEHRLIGIQVCNRIRQQREHFVFEPDNAFEAALFADNKVADAQYADHLYCALENSGIYDLEGKYIASYGQRNLGWLISDLRNEGIYLTYCWQHTEDDLTYIHDDLKRLGYRVGELLSYAQEEDLKLQLHQSSSSGSPASP